jgi:hypothetical protein
MSLLDAQVLLIASKAMFEPQTPLMMSGSPGQKSHHALQVTAASVGRRRARHHPGRYLLKLAALLTPLIEPKA